jgi:hypothetical protein
VACDGGAAIVDGADEVGASVAEGMCFSSGVGFSLRRKLPRALRRNARRRRRSWFVVSVLRDGQSEEPERDRDKERRSRRVATLAQAEAYGTKRPLSPLGESLVLGWRYRRCSRLAPVLLHWLWKTLGAGCGKCGT